ncbi:hypothetical protein F9817_20990 [Vibrio sp. CAIM 722]|uniref:Uncharacterized protein n=1 Tax=Vibrio eleionomae TaxID=2653505 RepID=A0A7X4RWS6_9VIBR|nr:hypothetical protein [Vibrio eleionomae]MZI95662.1 hypothetical protein [Vibrio eleionomae]
MTSLFDYIAAVKSQPSSVFISTVEHNTVDDSDGDVPEEESWYRFTNGALIRQQVEFDEPVNDDQVCQECWISYEVMEQPQSADITPRKKIFTNRCQETFWIKMNRQRQSQ